MFIAWVGSFFLIIFKFLYQQDDIKRDIFFVIKFKKLRQDSEICPCHRKIEWKYFPCEHARAAAFDVGCLRLQYKNDAQSDSTRRSSCARAEDVEKTLEPFSPQQMQHMAMFWSRVHQPFAAINKTQFSDPYQQLSTFPPPACGKVKRVRERPLAIYNIRDSTLFCLGACMSLSTANKVWRNISRP